MVNTEELTNGDFLNADTSRDQDVIVLLGGGKIGEITTQGKKKKVLNLPVRCDERDLTYTPGYKSLKMLQDIFGSTDSDEWKGKKFIAHHKEIEVAGKDIVVIRPKAMPDKPTEEISED